LTADAETEGITAQQVRDKRKVIIFSYSQIPSSTSLPRYAPPSKSTTGWPPTETGSPPRLARTREARPCQARSPRSPAPAAHTSSPTTGTRCTPTSATPLPARPGATTSTSTAASGTKCLPPGKENYRWPSRRTLCSSPAGPTGRR
jgi:hypothetical protein